MVEPAELHPYSDRPALDRLLLLIATLVQQPGIGNRDPLAPDTTSEPALSLVQTAMQTLAAAQGIPLPHYAIPTLRKDLLTLRRYGILSPRRHRTGYYLGTGGLTRDELHLALNALASLAKTQGDPLARQAHDRIQRRLRGLDLELNGNLSYPVRAHLNRTSVATDPVEMATRGTYQDTVFHQLATLEPAIRQGQTIEIVQAVNFYGDRPDLTIQIVPLQLLYHDIAWYLLGERLDGHFVIYRMNRLKNYCKILEPQGRGSDRQRQQLAIAHHLLDQGWGLFLGNPAEQQAERAGTLPLTTVKVRFYPPISQFILEGNYRHPQQKLAIGPIDPATGEPEHIHYQIKLPERSLKEFSHWLSRYMQHVQILAPASLAQQHYAAAQALLQRYTGAQKGTE